LNLLLVCGCKRFLEGIATGGGGLAFDLSFMHTTFVIFVCSLLLVLGFKLLKDLTELLTLFGA